MTWKEFEDLAETYLEKVLSDKFDRTEAITIGIHKDLDPHKFDLVSKTTIVECKANSWTKSDHVPSAKMSIWNEAMYLFSLVKTDHRKILFVNRHFNPKKKMTLAEYYNKNHSHLIPPDVEIWEYNSDTGKHKVIRQKSTTA